ncbi:MAG: hypothetical protein AMXMBFR7_50130 [Planctomycetota bacterium]
MPKLDTDLAPLLRLLLCAQDALHAADLVLLREPSTQALREVDAAAALLERYEGVFMEACKGRGIELPVTVEAKAGAGSWCVKGDGMGGLVVERG